MKKFSAKVAFSVALAAGLAVSLSGLSFAKTNYYRPYDGIESEGNYVRNYNGVESDGTYQRPYEGLQSDGTYVRPYEGIESNGYYDNNVTEEDGEKPYYYRPYKG